MKSLSSRFSTARPFAVAPMLRWTTPHCRYFYRLLAPRAELYTEMVIAQAFLKGGVEKYERPSWEHPIILQLAGSEPTLLGEAARVAKQLGFDGLNLNVGCPSERLQHLNSGAKAFLDPHRVGDCLHAMQRNSDLPVSVKTRIGVDEYDQAHDLWHFLDTTHQISGCTHYILHARKAWLSGLNPAQNRRCPPLDYSRVSQAKKRCPHLNIVLNGGLQTLEEAFSYASDHHLDGIMMGRAIWNDPKILLDVNQIFFNDPARISSENLFESLKDYLLRQQFFISRWQNAFFPLFNLFKGTPWSKQWKKECSALPKDKQSLKTLLDFYQKKFSVIENQLLNKNKACIR